jgi:hypothetical protein
LLGRNQDGERSERIGLLRRLNLGDQRLFQIRMEGR